MPTLVAFEAPYATLRGYQAESWARPVWVSGISRDDLVGDHNLSWVAGDLLQHIVVSSTLITGNPKSRQFEYSGSNWSAGGPSLGFI